MEMTAQRDTTTLSGGDHQVPIERDALWDGRLCKSDEILPMP